MTSLSADPTIRRQVIAAAREALDADPRAPVSSIAARAGVSRATLYRHFGSRDALLVSIERTERPSARDRVLAAAEEMLAQKSLAELSMDELARAADVSRGTLYRLFPGKAAVLEGLIDEFAPFDQVSRIIDEHHDEPPAVVLPMIAAAVLNVAREHLGLMRGIFLEVSFGSETAIAGLRNVFGALFAVLTRYMQRQIDAGNVRQSEPILAVQAFIAPILLHLLTRPVIEQIGGVETSVDEAVYALVVFSVRGISA